MKTAIRPAFTMFALLTLLTGVVYPLLVTGFAQAVVPSAANGSLIHRDGKAIGSALIGQPFDDPRYFWSRPSATAPVGYQGGASTGANLGPTNPALFAAISARIKTLRQTTAEKKPIPVDLVTTSASGLDPDISPAAAFYQVDRVAKERKIAVERLNRLVNETIEGRTFRLLGEPRVNVLKLNLALDALGNIPGS